MRVIPTLLTAYLTSASIPDIICTIKCRYTDLSDQIQAVKMYLLSARINSRRELTFYFPNFQEYGTTLFQLDTLETVLKQLRTIDEIYIYIIHRLPDGYSSTFLPLYTVYALLPNLKRFTAIITVKNESGINCSTGVGEPEDPTKQLHSTEIGTS